VGEFEGICISRLEIQMFFWPSVYFYNPFCLQGCFPRRPFVREFSLRTIYINFIVLCDDYLWDLCLHLSLQVSIVFIHSMMKAKKKECWYGFAIYKHCFPSWIFHISLTWLLRPPSHRAWDYSVLQSPTLLLTHSLLQLSTMFLTHKCFFFFLSLLFIHSLF